MTRQWLLFAGLAATAVACSNEKDAAEGMPPARGEGSIWLVSTEAPLGDPKAIEQRPLIEIDGTLTASDTGDLRPPRDWRVVYDRTGAATRVLTIRSAAGTDWKLGYRLSRAEPAMDVTPDPGLATGSQVHLRARFIWGFGSAPAFVLSDDKGIALVVDLALYGDPLVSGDVPGLSLRQGASIGIQRNECIDLRYTKLIFDAGAPIEVGQNETHEIAIAGTGYTALHLFNFVSAVPDKQPCPDAIAEGRAWAIWRRR
jgi:hypothetical protein